MMSNVHTTSESGEDRITAVTMRGAELGTALFTALIGGIVIVGAQEQGIGWTESGPDAGYFPFYIGVILVLASAGTILHTLARWKTLDATLLDKRQFHHVAAVFIPMCVYGVAIHLIGTYIASSIFIAWFMWRERDGKRYAPITIAAISIGVSVAVYLLFERWFGLPLNRGLLLGMMGISG
ncbi:tripartite tricarboxylate transporter TctB family protein [Noviherbaspirillum saxi]|uniref:Tripartite tricarboxylate transporter TctB family protein n=1 Tax=Noviherbaspirillum saxi TaxID=2320863 RepID=A0A3A3FMA9_9BURK|nr:tripartite tricarboxylate transporter TctB family protein [Noviherbaspirillum saxi]RJF95861.1 tripartite tricarboxylate transporter TctB family protein [Noviherbaspirillum saxi]